MRVIEAAQERRRICLQGLLHRAVGFIALDVAEVAAAQLVVAQRGIGVLHHVLLGATARFRFAVGDIGPQRELGFRRRIARGEMQARVLACGLQRQAEAGGRDHERAHVVLRDDFDRLIRAARAPEVGAEVAVRLRAQAEILDLIMLAFVVALAGGEQLAQHLQGLIEALARGTLVNAEAIVLAPAEPASDAADDLAVRAEEGVEHVHVFGDSHRVVPRQHGDHRAEVHALRDAGDVGEVLQRIGDHRIRREMMLNRPQRVEAGFIGDPRDVDFLVEDVAIGLARARRNLLAALFGLVAIPVGVVLIEDGGAYSHGACSPVLFV